MPKPTPSEIQKVQETIQHLTGGRQLPMPLEKFRPDTPVRLHLRGRDLITTAGRISRDERGRPVFAVYQAGKMQAFRASEFQGLTIPEPLQEGGQR